MAIINANTKILYLSTYPLANPANITTNPKTLILSTYAVNQGPQDISWDAYQLSPGTIIELFVVDLTQIQDTNGNPGSIYYFHSGKNQLNSDVWWQGQVYSAFPVEAEGFDLSTTGKLPKPKMKIANIDGSIGALNRSFSDMVGAKVTRKRTLVKYLDAVNFPGGINDLADPSQSFPDEIYYVNRKENENRVFAEYELASPMDVENVRLPRRQIIANMCPWVYKGAECGYAGSSYFTANDISTGNPNLDVCGKKLNSCKLRFGEFAELPFGGFPGAGLF